MNIRTPVAAAILLTTSALAVSAQRPTFSSKVQAVRVDVLVTDRGQPLTGLGRDDFEVYDNGVLQKVDFVGLEELPLKVILTLDMSDSVAGQPLADLRGAGRLLLSRLKPADSAALITFSHVVTLAANFTPDLEGVRAALDRAQASGSTSVVDAVYAAIILGESDVGRTLVILFSDSLDTSSWLDRDAVVDTANRSDAVVYGVWTGRPSDAGFLRDLTDETGGQLLKLESTRDLGGTFVKVLDEFRQRYVLSYSPRGVSWSDGWHRLDVRVKGRRATVRARPGYFTGS